MVIMIKRNGKQFYIERKNPRTSPVITPMRSKAWHFTDLNKCKPIRDDVLEFFKDAVIAA